MIKKCVLCSEEFESNSNNGKYCPKCREKIKKIYNKPYLSKSERRSLTKPKSINEIITELEEYNRINGTQLTYGKYVGMNES